jgi:hypothetical protein
MSKSKKAAGEVRQSQVLSTYGPGSMVDLPNHAVLIGGLNHWQGYKNQPIYEDRLASRLAEILGVSRVSMYAPPAQETELNAPRTGVKAFVFPTWFVAQKSEIYRFQGREYQSRALLPHDRLVNGSYLNDLKKKVSVVPIRFVQACPNGHISDIDWYKFVNRDCRSNCPAQLYLDEGGTGNNFADIFVRCEQCKKRRPLGDAIYSPDNILGFCQGNRPWLGHNAGENCLVGGTGTDNEPPKRERNRLLVRSASNAYFAQTLSVISIPDSDQKLKAAVDRVYEDYLQYAEDENDIRKERKKERVQEAISAFTDAQIWQEVERRQSGAKPPDRGIKQVELEAFLASDEEVGEDIPDGDFHARTRQLVGLPEALGSRIDRIVLVHRLREVIAQVGFTRFEPELPDIDGDLSLGVRRAALSLENNWLPAIENRGEGVLISFQAAAIQDWLTRTEVKARGKELVAGFHQWLGRRGLNPDEVKFPGLPYIMLHSLSHLLITSISLECGYAASSIRERIYAGDYGYGILLYTGSSSSEGTLGGLVQIGDRIEHHLISALEYGKLCSNDPVCSQHKPENAQVERFLHGSACHSCLLIAEPSCERRNEFLDRDLVVNTLNSSGAAFFPDCLDES